MAASFHAFVLAGTGSGCGKTTVTLGLLSLMKKRGLRVQPCKVGPDYLDTGWHTAVCGTASRNLDSFMLPTSTLNALFCEQMQHADIAVIEGVMGLYDGYGTDPDYCSTAAMAKQLGCPVILLVDGKAVSTSIAATVMGFQHFDPSLNIAGVIVNRVNSETHYQLLKVAIERYCSVPVLGYQPAAVAGFCRDAGTDAGYRRVVGIKPVKHPSCWRMARATGSRRRGRANAGHR